MLSIKDFLKGTKTLTIHSLAKRYKFTLNSLDEEKGTITLTRKVKLHNRKVISLTVRIKQDLTIRTSNKIHARGKAYSRLMSRFSIFTDRYGTLVFDSMKHSVPSRYRIENPNLDAFKQEKMWIWLASIVKELETNPDIDAETPYMARGKTNLSFLYKNNIVKPVFGVS